MGEADAPDGRCTPIPLVLCLFQMVRGGTNVMYAIGFGKETLFGSLSMSSMVHEEGMFCLGRQSGEIGDGRSDLCFLLIRVGELKSSGGVGLVRVWIGVIVGGCTLPFIIVSLLFRLCKLWDVR